MYSILKPAIWANNQIKNISMNHSNYPPIEYQAEQFYSEYESILTATENYLLERLKILCIHYCKEHNLPPEAITVLTRRKSIKSFVNKLKRRGVLDISDNSENITDTVGARLICWFVDDCFGILEVLKKDEHIRIIPKSIENFIENPKETGYRSIHILTKIDSDLLELNDRDSNSIKDIICEIQIRTKLQDSWAEITHEFHYKAKYAGISNPTYESLLGDISDRLALEDKTLMKFRDAYGELANGNNETI